MELRRTEAPCGGRPVASAMESSYRQFAELAELHRHLVGIVDQKVGAEKAIVRKYIAAIDRRLMHHPRRGEYFVRWRQESTMVGR